MVTIDKPTFITHHENHSNSLCTYPSYVINQSFYTQSFLGISSDGGNSITHKLILTNNPPAQLEDYPLAKKGAPLISDPSNPLHLAFVFLSGQTGDLDVYLTETYDAGTNWSTPQRINDDPIGNNRMQDMAWADFDEDGDLVISWRDRRNGADSTYQATTEIWAAFRCKDSLDFEANFQLTNQAILHDSDLERSGNDFMCVQLQNDTLNAAWGDPRNGEINIWFQRLDTKGRVLSSSLVASDKAPSLSIFPNPTHSVLTIQGEALEYIQLYDWNGKILLTKKDLPTRTAIVPVEHLDSGTYIVKVKHKYGLQCSKFIKK